MMYWGSSWSWWGWLLMTFSMIAFWGLVIWAVVALFRRSDRERPEVADPARILAERFARGEIDEDEYTRRRQLLRASR